MVELLQDKAEAVCGFRPNEGQTIRFLQTIGGAANPGTGRRTVVPPKVEIASGRSDTGTTAKRLAIDYRIFGEARSAPNASRALVDILRTIVARDPSLLPRLSDAVRTKNKRHVGQTPVEINPNRPDLARGEEIYPGWLVGLNIDNREKQMIIDAACELYGLRLSRDVDVTLPNS